MRNGFLMRGFGLLLAMFVFAAFYGADAQPAQQLSAAGLWRTISDVDGQPRGLVRVVETNGVFVGSIAGTLVPGESPNSVCVRCRGALRNSRLMGLQILSGLRRRGPAEFGGGRILDPDTGNTYSVSARLSPDGQRMTLRGYVGIEALGRSQTWERVE